MVLNNILSWVNVKKAEEKNKLICTINIENDALEGSSDLGTIAQWMNH